ncbi:DUF2079 domain-containing protein [Kitasatospora sp. NPDC088391]|uniref:DUF2079 domain-containing protein n=1 Tax=Kitasatospora sp. NPDC088391 TaxID=3364074 RepID=UPI0038177D08
MRFSFSAPVVALPVLLFHLALSLPRQWRIETTGFDLGIFEEAVRGYAGGGPPVVVLKGAGFDLLGDHFSPALVVLAPFYRLWPAAETLLVAQSVLFALSALPVAALAGRRFGRVGGVAAGWAYGLSWGLWRASQFDVHEVALGVPLAAAATVALAERRWRAAVCWALPLLLVKEDQGLLLAGVGGYVLLAGRRRALGAATVAAAVLGTALAVLVLVPAANPTGGYAYGSWVGPDGGNPLARLLFPAEKWGTVGALLAPTLLLALRSPLALLAVLPLAARFWSPVEAYWGTGFHYNAVLMPVLFVAGLDGLWRLTGRRGGQVPVRVLPPAVDREPRRAPVPAVPVPAVFALAGMVLLALLAVPRPDLSGPGAEALTVRRVLSAVPDGARVAAANRLAPQLTSRCAVSLFPYLSYPDGGSTGLSSDGRDPRSRPVAEWAATLDAPEDFPVPRARELDVQRGLPAAGYRPVARGGGVTVWHWQRG